MVSPRFKGANEMKKNWIAVVVGSLLTVGAAAQTAAGGAAQAQGAQAGNASVSANAAPAPGGFALPAELTKSVEAKKAKAGDEVTARVLQDVKSSSGQVVIRRGAKLVGHVTEAQARSKENPESRLGLVFDKAVAKDGSEMPLNAVVQALAPAQRVAAPNLGDDNSRMAGVPAPVGGTPAGAMGGNANPGAGGSTMGEVGRTTGNLGGTAAGAAGETVGGGLNGSSRGVIGLRGLTLNSGDAGNGASSGSVVSSSSENVKLDSGTQLILMVNAPNQK
jgi:hypothetical protein